MQLDWIKPLIGIPGPFATVYLDATRGDESGYREVMNRWQGLKRSLTNQHTPEEILSLLEDRVSQATHATGQVGRFLIVGRGEVLVDRVMKTPPLKDEAIYAGAPALRAAAAATDDQVNYFLVEINRMGADVKTPDPQNPFGPLEIYAQIAGEHDVVHKVRGGGFHHGRLQNRAQDSWERNADYIANHLDELVTTDRPELLILSGDVRAVGLVEERLGEPARKISTQLPGGGRNEGAEDAHFQQQLESVLDDYRQKRRGSVIARFEQELGRDEAAVTGQEDVLQALRRGQVSELLLQGDGSSSPEPETSLWIGQGALEVSDSESEVRELSDTAEELSADIALLRAAVGQDAGVTFVNDSLTLPGGVGALLRWKDAATPDENVLSFSDDSQRLRAEPY